MFWLNNQLFTIVHRYNDAVQLQWQWIWQRYKHGSYTPLFRRPFGHLSAIFGIWHKVNVILSLNSSWKQNVSSMCIFVVRRVSKLALLTSGVNLKNKCSSKKIALLSFKFFFVSNLFTVYLYYCRYQLNRKSVWWIYYISKIIPAYNIYSL